MRVILSCLICIAAILLFNRDHIGMSQVKQAISTLKTRITNINSTAVRASAPMSSPSPAFAGLPVIPPNDTQLASTAPMGKVRGIAQAFLAREQSEGAGAKVRRSIGTPRLRNFSPFLMLDHFSVSPPAGFPDHPHRGQETVTYLIEGSVDHEDFVGHKGTIHSGDLQFMTAGRGIMHAEMPGKSDDGAPNVGLQLWVDLPKALKACEPRYRDLRAAEIPVASPAEQAGKVAVKVISGKSYGVESLKELAYTPVWLLHVSVKKGGVFEQRLPKGWNAFAYILDGAAWFGKGADAQTVKKYHNVVFEKEGEGVVAEVPQNADEDVDFVLVAGMPLDQPVVQYGPFVLSSQDEVRQAMVDFSTYSNGFERAYGWQSEIGKALMY